MVYITGELYDPVLSSLGLNTNSAHGIRNNFMVYPLLIQSYNVNFLSKVIRSWFFKNCFVDTLNSITDLSELPHGKPSNIVNNSYQVCYLSG